MAMTAAVKDELSRVEINKASCRKAEVATILRFAGGLHLVAGHIVIEADLDTGATARRLKKDLFDIYGHESEIVVVQPSGLRKGSRYLVRVVEGGEALARQTGIVQYVGCPRSSSPVG
jgi:DNA-binding protein WhiA